MVVGLAAARLPGAIRIGGLLARGSFSRTGLEDNPPQGDRILRTSCLFAMASRGEAAVGHARQPVGHRSSSYLSLSAARAAPAGPMEPHMPSRHMRCALTTGREPHRPVVCTVGVASDGPSSVSAAQDRSATRSRPAGRYSSRRTAGAASPCIDSRALRSTPMGRVVDAEAGMGHGEQSIPRVGSFALARSDCASIAVHRVPNTTYSLEAAVSASPRVNAVDRNRIGGWPQRYHPSFSTVLPGISSVDPSGKLEDNPLRRQEVTRGRMFDLLHAERSCAVFLAGTLHASATALSICGWNSIARNSGIEVEAANSASDGSPKRRRYSRASSRLSRVASTLDGQRRLIGTVRCEVVASTSGHEMR